MYPTANGSVRRFPRKAAVRDFLAAIVQSAQPAAINPGALDGCLWYVIQTAVTELKI